MAGVYDMACFSPFSAFRMADGSVSFKERGDIIQSLSLPCGSCDGCRLERSRQWAVRCMHESRLHNLNCFITLTYDDKHLPHDGSLRYKDFQQFMRYLRKRFPDNTIRFYMGGEYGSTTFRPHYHACLFGIDFQDREIHSVSDSGHEVSTSKVLSSLWKHGFASVGDFTFQSAAYVARYVVKKVVGSKSDVRKHYEAINLETGEVFDRVPEFNRMSLKPGIGRPWLDKYLSDVYPHDRVVVDGVPTKPPKYYDKVYSLIDPLSFEAIQFARYERALDNASDNTPERLASRAVCTAARLSQLKRTL